MPLNHDVVFTKLLDIFEEVMIEVVYFVVYVLLEKVDEIVGVPHYFGFHYVLV